MLWSQQSCCSIGRHGRMQGMWMHCHVEGNGILMPENTPVERSSTYVPKPVQQLAAALLAIPKHYCHILLTCSLQQEGKSASQGWLGSGVRLLV